MKITKHKTVVIIRMSHAQFKALEGIIDYFDMALEQTTGAYNDCLRFVKKWSDALIVNKEGKKDENQDN